MYHPGDQRDQCAAHPVELLYHKNAERADLRAHVDRVGHHDLIELQDDSRRRVYVSDCMAREADQRDGHDVHLCKSSIYPF